jgi:hypothetical protein
MAGPTASAPNWLKLTESAKHLSRFGVATECGLGRRQPESLAEFLRIHREVAERLDELST